MAWMKIPDHIILTGGVVKRMGEYFLTTENTENTEKTFKKSP
jgi:hypothetical protein